MPAFTDDVTVEMDGSPALHLHSRSPGAQEYSIRATNNAGPAGVLIPGLFDPGTASASVTVRRIKIAITSACPHRAPGAGQAARTARLSRKPRPETAAENRREGVAFWPRGRIMTG